MKKLLALALVALMAGAAMAQPVEDENMLGMFFTNDLAQIAAGMGEMPHPDTNFPNTFTPFNAYIVMLNPTVESVGAYEVGIGISDPTVFVLSATGPNGWTNFGSSTNHIAGYATPLPTPAEGAVLGTLQMLYTGTAVVEISFDAAEPSSFDGLYPGCTNGADPEELIAFDAIAYNGATEPMYPVMVSTINGDGVVATEAHSFSSVKALFD